MRGQSVGEIGECRVPRDPPSPPPAASTLWMQRASCISLFHQHCSEGLRLWGGLQQKAGLRKSAFDWAAVLCCKF